MKTEIFPVTVFQISPVTVFLSYRNRHSSIINSKSKSRLFYQEISLFGNSEGISIWDKQVCQTIGRSEETEKVSFY